MELRAASLTPGLSKAMALKQIKLDSILVLTASRARPIPIGSA